MKTLHRQIFYYYFIIIFTLLLTVSIFVTFLQVNSNSLHYDLSKEILYDSKFFWYTGALVAITNIVGLLVFGPTAKRDSINAKEYSVSGWNIKKLLIVVYVSKGDNYKALERSIIATSQVLDDLAVNYRIDVVTDIQVSDKHSHYKNVVYHLVPEDYETKEGARYKARALHYVVEQHSVESLHNDKDTWVLHLDEESQIDPSAVVGINTFINNSENELCIGQGEIKYNAHNYGNNWLITAMDAIRSGDDLGRFRFQYKIFGRPLFGMHGSFILLPGKLEQKYGFDLGGKGSITEDAYFALKCSASGHKFKWVDGFIREQSPFTLKAIIKQRRRWYCGLVYLAFDSKINLRVRAPLMLNMILWSVAWIGPIVTIVNLILGGYFPVSLILLAAILQGCYASVYMIGLWHNLQDVNINKIKALALYISTFVLLPVVNLIEGLSVIYGITRPVKSFEIVNKN